MHINLHTELSNESLNNSQLQETCLLVWMHLQIQDHHLCSIKACSAPEYPCSHVNVNMSMITITYIANYDYSTRKMQARLYQLYSRHRVPMDTVIVVDNGYCLKEN